MLKVRYNIKVTKEKHINSYIKHIYYQKLIKISVFLFVEKNTLGILKLCVFKYIFDTLKDDNLNVFH